jgi:hypothetical protein
MLHFLVDWAGRWDWRSEGVSPDRLVEAVQRGQRIGIYQDAGRTDWWPAQLPLPAGIERIPCWPPDSSYDLVVVISDRLIEIGEHVARTVIYRPRTLTLGVSGLPVEEPEEFHRTVVEFFQQQHLSLASLTALATPRGDSGTPIFYDWAETQRLPLLEYAPERLALLRPCQGSRENRWWETEAAAMLAASTRHLLVPATVCQGWTLAIARRQTG